MTEEVKSTLQSAAIPLACILTTYSLVMFANFKVEHDRKMDVAAWEVNPPVAYLDGQMVNLELLDLRHYSWSYSEETNTVKLTRRVRGCYDAIEYNPNGGN